MKSTVVETLNSNTTRYQVNAATNGELQVPNNPFQSDSLAQSGSGMLFSVDASGMIFDVTGPFQISVGPTSRTQSGDLVMGVNGVWGFSNASAEFFLPRPRPRPSGRWQTETWAATSPTSSLTRARRCMPYVGSIGGLATPVFEVTRNLTPGLSAHVVRLTFQRGVAHEVS